MSKKSSNFARFFIYTRVRIPYLYIRTRNKEGKENGR